eukprot:scaffold300_cov144-Isochrysis_galbana.AAC.1
MTWSSSSSPGKLALGGAGITKRPPGRKGGTDARTAPHATIAPAPAGVAAEVGGGGGEAHSLAPPAVSSEPQMGPQAAPPCEEAAPTAPNPSHRPAQPLRSRVEAQAPRGEPCPSPPSEWGASPPSRLARRRW